MEDNLDKLGTIRRDLLKIPTNRRDVNRIAAQIVNSILDGDSNSLEVEIKLRYLEKLIENIRGNIQIKGEVMREAELYPDKTFQAYGAEVTKTSRGTYDYASTGDIIHDELIKEIAGLNGKRKEREDFLKSLKDEVADPETGNIIQPPAKKSTDSIRVKLL